MSHARRDAPSGPRRGQTQRIASGARSAPYARPELQRDTSRGSYRESASNSRAQEQWPPNQLSIRGASGPTWIIVANLLRGTTDADIRETFRQFGDIEDVKTRKAPSENHPSVAFEIAFTQRSAANVAVEKLDGALADGRLLQVSLRDGNKFAQPSPSLSASMQTPPIASASASRELFPSIPSGPRSQQRGANNNNGRELLQTRPQQAVAHAQQPAASTPRAPKAAKASIMQPTSLQSRIMSAAELKSLQKQQARAGIKPKSLPGVPTGPKGTVATPATSSSIPLSKRITLPLAMRLNEEAKKGGPASGRAHTGPAKKRKAKGKARAKNANGMEVD